MKCALCKKETKKIITDTIRGGEKRKVYYCQACDFGMLELLGKNQNSKEFYDKVYRKSNKPLLNSDSTTKQLFDVYAPFQEERIRLLKIHTSKNSSLLEVGCSAGMFLFHAKKEVKRVAGVDYDTQAADFAAKKCQCEVFGGDLRESGFPEHSFDMVCAFQTLEHVDDPLDFLLTLKRYLKPHGKIYIEVPNLHDSLAYAYDLPGHYQFYFHSAHPWYFTKKSLGIAMKKAGFSGNFFFTQDYNILNHFHWLAADRPQPSYQPGLSQPLLPLRKQLPLQKKRAMQKFIREVDQKYKTMLSDLELTSNISFIGKQK